MRSKKRSMGLVCSAAALSLVAGTALSGEPDQKDGSQGVTLGGPKVDDGGKPDQGTNKEGERRERTRDREGDRAREAPRMVEYMAAVRTLRQADASLAITAEQRETIGGVVRAHRAAMAEFMAEHKEEIEDLRAQAGLPERERPGIRGERDGRGEGGERRERPDRARRGDRPQPENEMSEPGEGGHSGDDSTMGHEGDKGNGQARPHAPTKQQMEARESLRKLMEKGPDEGAAVRSIEAALSPEQVKTVRTSIQETRKRRAESTAERRERGPQETDRVRQERRGDRPARPQRDKPEDD